MLICQKKKKRKRTKEHGKVYSVEELLLGMERGTHVVGAKFRNNVQKSCLKTT